MDAEKEQTIAARLAKLQAKRQKKEAIVGKLKEQMQTKKQKQQARQDKENAKKDEELAACNKAADKLKQRSHSSLSSQGKNNKTFVLGDVVTRCITIPLRISSVAALRFHLFLEKVFADGLLVLLFLPCDERDE